MNLSNALFFRGFSSAYESFQCSRLTNCRMSDLATFQLIYMICLVVIGIPGNLYALVKLSLTRSPKRHTAPFLLCLSLGNVAFLAAQIPTLGVIKDWSKITCSTVLFVNYVSCFIVSWAITIFTIERFIAVYFPLYHMRLSASNQSTITSVVLMAVASIYHIWIPIIVEVQQFPFVQIPIDNSNDVIPQLIKSNNHLQIARQLNLTIRNAENCGYSDEKLFKVFEILDFLFSFTIPLMVLLILNSMTAVRIFKSKQTRLAMQSGSVRMDGQRADNEWRTSNYSLTNLVFHHNHHKYRYSTPSYRSSQESPIDQRGDPMTRKKLKHLDTHLSLPLTDYERRQTSLPITVASPTVLRTLVSDVQRNDRDPNADQKITKLASEQSNGMAMKVPSIQKASSLDTDGTENNTVTTSLPVPRTRVHSDNSKDRYSYHQTVKPATVIGSAVTSTSTVSSSQTLSATHAIHNHPYGSCHSISRLRRATESLRTNVRELRVTFVLLGLSACYLVLNLPQYVFRLLILTNMIDIAPAEAHHISNVVQLIFSTQFAVNFLLYALHETKPKRRADQRSSKARRCLEGLQQLGCRKNIESPTIRLKKGKCAKHCLT